MKKVRNMNTIIEPVKTLNKNIVYYVRWASKTDAFIYYKASSRRWVREYIDQDFKIMQSMKGTIRDAINHQIHIRNDWKSKFNDGLGIVVAEYGTLDEFLVQRELER